MKIKILFDTHTFDVEHQGTSTFLAGLINAIPPAIKEINPNINIEIHCASSNPEKLKKCIDVNYIFHEINTNFIYRNLIWMPITARKINADFVVSQYVRPIWVPKYSASIIHDLLFIDFPKEFTFKYRFIRYILFGLSALLSTKIFTVSKYSRDRISEIYKLKRDQIEILPNSVSIDSKKNIFQKKMKLEMKKK